MNPAIRVLCVDDEASFLELAKLVLERSGLISLEAAQSATDALQMLDKSEYDVVVSDYAMPGMDGIEFLKALRAQEDTTPFIMFTGKGREEVAMEALNNGADLYIQKGSDVRAQFAELTMMVKKLSDHRKAEQKARRERDVCNLLVEAEIVGFVAFDSDSKILLWNPGMERISGVRTQNAVGKRFEEIIPTLDGRDIGEYLREVLSGKKLGLRDIAFAIPETKREGYFRSFSAPTLDATGTVTGGFTILVDSSEERAFQDAYQSSMSRYSALFEGAGDAIFVHSLDGRFLDVNQTACDALGYTREELLNMTPKDVDDAASSEKVSGRMEEILRSGSGSFEAVHIRKDGTTYPVELNVRVIHEGPKPMFITIARDISERKKSEDALRRSEEFLANVFSSIQDGISILDDSLTVRRVNHSMEGWYEHKMPIIGKKCYEVHQWRDEPCEDCPARRTLETGRVDSGLVTKRGSKGEAKGWLDVYTFPIIDSDTGAVTGVIEYLRDVTERVKTSEALARSEKRYRQLVELLGEGVLAVDASGKITFVNPRVGEMSGYGDDEMIGREIFDFLDAEDKELVANQMSTRRNGVRGHYDVNIIRKDGSRMNVSIGASPLFSESGEFLGSLAVLVDLTNRKQIEDALRIANEKLRLLGAITRHDVVNQLVVLSGYLGMASTSSDGDKARAFIEKARQASSMIQDQLEFAQDFQQIGSRTPEWINASVTLDSALASVGIEAVSIESDIGGVELWADTMLEKVFVNLIDNSLRHGGGITRIGISYERRGDELVVKVEDDGVGVPAEDKERIFERGYGKNTGLGLFLIREVLAITGFSIEETGEEGKGARFEITVPEGRYRFAQGMRPATD
ncbi:MAG: PAS domain S-box protein [Methanobacteriota archaeon]|nr:MAG: PAS domain S-box protein [Euryarchaeota archaeon]